MNSSASRYIDAIRRCGLPRGKRMYDITIIGAGIAGCYIARELARYKLSIALLDRENDVSDGQTKANSAIIHAGYDAHVDTLMGKLNARGNPMFDRVCEELDVPLQRTGSLVLAFDDEQLPILRELYENGSALDIPGLEILSPSETKRIEPNVVDSIKGSLYAETAGIIGPWELAIALTENAIDNGADLKLNHEVTAIEKLDEGFVIRTGGGDVESRYVINAAGLYADVINDMVAEPFFEINPKRGQYYLLDKNAGGLVNTVVFQCPTKAGKGVLVSPTVHGNVIVGPDAENLESREDVRTTGNRLEYVREMAAKSIKDIPYHYNITTFAGIRAEPSTKDFIVAESKNVKGFINVAGIKSPGLSSSPAIAEDVVEIVREIAGGLEEKPDFNPRRRPLARFHELSDSEKAELIRENPRFGRIVCRCETVTEGELIDVIHRSCGARTVDGVKRRARPGTGRCQGGFCSPRVIEILARELGVDLSDITKDSERSYILTGRTKGGSVAEQQARGEQHATL